MMRQAGIGALLLLSGASSCGGKHEASQTRYEPTGRILTVHETAVTAVLNASGTARPVQVATLSTKLMGSVTSVEAREGERVEEGRVLAEVDAREMNAQRDQATAALASADAEFRDARTQATRMRALYADSAAPKADLDRVEVGLVRAEAARQTAVAALASINATAGYASIRAPFAGLVVKRYVDPGTFVAPGSPIIDVQDDSRLRISVSTPSPVAARISRGSRIDATVEGVHVIATVEGVVPAGTGAIYTVNALVPNAEHRLPANGAATLAIATGKQNVMLVPIAAVFRQGDLTGVRLSGAKGPELRWLRVGRTTGSEVEVLSGLSDGDRVLVPAAGAQE